MLLLLNAFLCEAQTITTWHNDQLDKVNKEQATQRVEIELRDKKYYRSFYSIRSGKLKSSGLYADTGWFKPLGLHISYDSTGVFTDSSIYNNESKKIYAAHYYPSGKLFIKYASNPANSTETIKAFEESGKNIPNFVYEREADFAGGFEGWKKHLIKHLKPSVPVRKKAKAGRYPVIIRFIVTSDGSIREIVPETSYGHGMEEEAMRVIRLSPNWMPAIQYNKKVNAYRRQPILFVVEK